MTTTSTRTFQLGLVGFPLGHSLSPALHRAALRASGLRGDYATFAVPPDDVAGLVTILGRVRSGELAGLNVTIPHKQAVIPLLDQLSPAARAIGAVNTIYLEGDALTGANTDAPAFIADLKTTLLEGSKPSSRLNLARRRSALVLGAGGSARAVVYALLQAGWEVTVAARRIERAHALAAQLGSVRTAELDAAAGIAPADFQDSSPQLIVNTTPLGMHPNVDASPWPASVAFPAEARIYDLVYNPRETLLVRRARAAGLQAVTGVGMLVQQAALAFEQWTAVRVSPEVMRGALDA